MRHLTLPWCTNVETWSCPCFTCFLEKDRPLNLGYCFSNLTHYCRKVPGNIKCAMTYSSNVLKPPLIFIYAPCFMKCSWCVVFNLSTKQVPRGEDIKAKNRYTNCHILDAQLWFLHCAFTLLERDVQVVYGENSGCLDKISNFVFRYHESTLNSWVINVTIHGVPRKLYALQIGQQRRPMDIISRSRVEELNSLTGCGYSLNPTKSEIHTSQRAGVLHWGIVSTLSGLR